MAHIYARAEALRNEAEAAMGAVVAINAQMRQGVQPPLPLGTPPPLPQVQPPQSPLQGWPGSNSRPEPPTPRLPADVKSRGRDKKENEDRFHTSHSAYQFGCALLFLR
jgi:hypothetical protein